MRRQLPSVLLTRPLADSLRFAEMLAGMRVVISPILQIQPVEYDVARLLAAKGLVFTSAHAVPAAGPGKGRLALCVGGRTAQAAEMAGFKVQEGNGFADGLFSLIKAAEVPLLHPHGQHLAAQLPVEGMVVYDQLPQPLNPAAITLLAGQAPVILPIFSQRSARLIAEQVIGCTAPIRVAAISNAVLGAFDGLVAMSAVADEPSSDAMAKVVGQLINS